MGKVIKPASKLDELLTKAVMIVVVSVVWFVIGFFISAPFIFFAGGTEDGPFFNPLGIVFAPIIALATVLALYIFITFAKNRTAKIISSGITIGFVCLPIIANVTSLLLGFLGTNKLSHFIFECRWYSWWIVVFSIVGVLFVWFPIENFIDKWKMRRKQSTHSASPLFEDAPTDPDL